MSEHLSLVQMHAGTSTAGREAGGEEHALPHTSLHSRCFMAGMSPVDAAANTDVSRQGQTPPAVLPTGVLASLRPPALRPAACIPQLEGLAGSAACLSGCPLSAICPSPTCRLPCNLSHSARCLSAVRRCDLGMACRFGDGRCNVGVGVGSGWGLRGSSMSNCLLVWLIGILDLELAPVGGVLASKAPPAYIDKVQELQ